MAILNIKLAKEKCRKHFNEIGIYGGTRIGRLIGYGEDDSDCYYLLRFPPRIWGEKYYDVYCSMVGGWFSIKRMGKTAYNYTDINSGIPKAEEFVEKYFKEF